MARQITIEIPDVIDIASAKDAPERWRSIKTDKWTAETVVDAIEFAVSERLGNIWSVGKKDHDKMEHGHKSLSEGNWNAKTRGVSSAKFDEAIKKLNVAALVGKLTREQLMELASKISPDGEVKF
jgi:hypothetical protein